MYLLLKLAFKKEVALDVAIVKDEMLCTLVRYIFDLGIDDLSQLVPLSTVLISRAIFITLCCVITSPYNVDLRRGSCENVLVFCVAGVDQVALELKRQIVRLELEGAKLPLCKVAV